MHFSQRLDHLVMRVRNMLGIGRVTIVNDAGPVQTMQVTINYGEVKDNSVHIGHFGLAYNPPPGTDLVFGFVSGDRSNGLSFASNNKMYRMRNLLTGETALYDAMNKYIYLAEDGIHIVAAGLPVIIDDCSTFTVNASEAVIFNTPLVKSSGDMLDNYNTNSDTAAGARGRYNSHTHPGIEPGDSNTGTPNVDE
jgi:phage gp45-like